MGRRRDFILDVSSFDLFDFGCCWIAFPFYEVYVRCCVVENENSLPGGWAAFGVLLPIFVTYRASSWF